MSRSAQRARPRVEAHVTFEVSHLAADCMADAYERIVPTARRVARMGRPQRPVKQAETLYKEGVRAC